MEPSQVAVVLGTFLDARRHAAFGQWRGCGFPSPLAISLPMRHKTDMIAALERQPPHGALPLWELEFQLWDAFSGGHLVLGAEFAELSVASQQRVVGRNAELILAVCRVQREVPKENYRAMLAAWKRHQTGPSQ